MADDSINIEQLQSEIDRAESYLNQVTHTRVSDWNRTSTSGQNQLRQSSHDPDFLNSASVNSSYSSTSSTNRYADPVEREKLLQRLLADHGTRSRQHSEVSTPNYSHSRRQPRSGGDSSDRESFTLSHGDVDYTSDGRMGVSPGQDTLFFASEYLNTSTPHSGASGKKGNRYFKEHNTAGSTLSVDSMSREEYHEQQQDHDYSYAATYATESKSPGPARTHRPGRSISPDMSRTFLSRGRHLEDIPAVRRGRSQDPRAARQTQAQTGLTPSPVDKDGKDNTRKYLKSKQEIIEEAKREFRKQHPFTPQVMTRPQRSSSAPRRASTDRIDAMLKAHEQSLAHRDYQRIALQRSEVETNCTFRPKLSKGTQHILQQKAEEATYQGDSPSFVEGVHSSSDRPASERLYAYAEQKEAQRREMRRKVELARRHEYTYQPAINPATNTMVRAMDKEYRPIYERVGELQREQAMNKQILLECHEQAQSEMTFQPEINEKSRRLAERRYQHRDDADDDNSNRDYDSVEEKRSTEDVGTRLMHEARVQMQKKFKLVEDREREVSEQFQDPKPCKGSDDIIRRNSTLSSKDFLSRQQQYNEKTKDRIASSRQREEQECSSWFKPEITGATNDILSERRPELAEESQEQRMNRLYREDKENIDHIRQKKEDEIYGSISFVPDIDPISRALGRAATIDELVKNRRGRRVKERVKQQVEQKQSSECSFRPQIKASQDSFVRLQRSAGKKCPDAFKPPLAWCDHACPLDSLENDLAVSRPPGSINMKEPDKMARDIRLNQMEKEERRRAELIVKEVDELKECTFQPKINKTNRSKSNQPVVVRGIGRHFELKNLLHRQKEIAARRHEEAFKVKNVDEYRRQADGRTIVQPFRLAETSYRRSRVVEDMEQDSEANLTFFPQTNESRRKSFMQSLVRTDL